MRVIGYTRVSTDEQATTGHGLNAQRDALEAEAARRGWELNIVEEAASGKSVKNRPVLCAALDALRRHEADALAVAKLDRLSRSLPDFAGLLERARREGWNAIALDLGVDTSTATGELVANVMMSVAQWERRAISDRTSAGLAAARAQGVRLGAPSKLDREAVEYAVKLRGAGLSLKKIAETLTSEGYTTAKGSSKWFETTVARLLRTRQLDQEAAARRAVGIIGSPTS